MLTNSELGCSSTFRFQGSVEILGGPHLVTTLGCMDRWGYHQLPRKLPGGSHTAGLVAWNTTVAAAAGGFGSYLYLYGFWEGNVSRGKGGGNAPWGTASSFPSPMQEKNAAKASCLPLTPSISEAHHFEANPFGYDVNWGHKQLGNTKHQQRSTPPEIDPSRSDLSLKGGHSTGSMSVVQTQCNIWWLRNRDVFLFKAFVKLSPLL